MRRDQCGFGRDPESMDPITRYEVQSFGAFLAGRQHEIAGGFLVQSQDWTDEEWTAVLDHFQPETKSVEAERWIGRRRHGMLTDG